jgi:predicted nucleotide-binding protein
MNQHLEQKLIAELSDLLDGSSQPLAPIVQKASRLAAIRGKAEYRMLFDLHLAGFVEEKDVSTLRKWTEPTKPRWDPVNAFFADRRVSGERFQSMALPELDRRERELHSALSSRDKEWDWAQESSMRRVSEILKELRAVLDRIRLRVHTFLQEIVTESTQQKRNSDANVFIGHGHATSWMELKSFLKDRLRLGVVEYNIEPTAGKTRIERLRELLNTADFAFLVLTGEDGDDSGTLHARENVIHETGLFQARLGFNRAIILLEENCTEFSNIHGLDQIRFPKGLIKAAFEDVRFVLEREGLS